MTAPRDGPLSVSCPSCGALRGRQCFRLVPGRKPNPNDTGLAHAARLRRHDEQAGRASARG